MIPRALPIAAFVVLLGAASVAPSAFGATAAPVVSVRPGVAGTARPGRWLPVDVTVTTSDAAFDGALVVEWGGATSTRDLALGRADTEHVSVLVRTVGASPSVRVRLIDRDGAPIAETTSALALLPVDTPALLCIGHAAADAACTIRIAEADAPVDWRGFDVADAVRWPDAARSASTPAARAFATWQAARWWLDSGAVDPVVAPFDTASRLADRTAISLTLYVVGLLIVTSLAAWRRAPAVVLLVVPLVAASAGAALVQRRTQDVDIQASSFVHAFAGTATAVVLTRGEVEHPGPDPLELDPAVDGAVVDVIRAPQRTEAYARRDGRSIYRHTAGRAVRQRFELNATTSQPWLDVVADAGGVAITNRSNITLTDCRVRAVQNASAAPATLAPAATARLAMSGPFSRGDTITCRLPADWMRWTSRGGHVTTRGSAFLIFHQWGDDAAR